LNSGVPYFMKVKSSSTCATMPSSMFCNLSYAAR
jgi:hypothetical protein